jgi:hypothetical protein
MLISHALLVSYITLNNQQRELLLIVSTVRSNEAPGKGENKNTAYLLLMGKIISIQCSAKV